MVGEFALLDERLGVPAPAGRLWTVIEVALGYTTDWRLRIRLEDGEREIVCWFENPASFRVLDEGEILTYWDQRRAEAVGVGTLYSIARSTYLDELSQGVSAQTLREGESLRHYLLAGMDNCVEVLSREPPSFAFRQTEDPSSPK